MVGLSAPGTKPDRPIAEHGLRKGFSPWAYWSKVSGRMSGYDTESTGGQASSAAKRRCATGSPRTARPDLPGRAASRPRPGSLPSLRVPRLSLGAPHADLQAAQGPGRHDRRLGGPLVHGRERLDLQGGGRRHRGQAFRPRLSASALHQGRAEIFGPCDRAGALGQEEGDDRQQRVLRNHSHVQQRVRRRRGRRRATTIPEAQRDAIDEINDEVYDNVNNGVYKSGFATAQDAYDDAVMALFRDDGPAGKAPRRESLSGQAIRITEADWRLFTTLVRFDPVYVGHFKCNLRRLVDYPNLCRPMRASSTSGQDVAATVDFHHIKNHYYSLAQHRSIRPASCRRGRSWTGRRLMAGAERRDGKRRPCGPR